MKEQSDALDEAIEIMMQEPHMRVGHKIIIKVETTIYVLNAIRKALTEHAALKDIDPRTGVQRMIDIDFINERLKNAIAFREHKNLLDAARAVTNHIRSGGNFGENAALKEQVKGLSQTIDSQAMTFNALSKKAKALEAENARLRRALDSVCNSAVDCAQFKYEMMVKREVIHAAENTLKGQDNDTE